MDMHLGIGQPPRALVVLLAGLGRQPFALQHLQELLDGLVSGAERLLLRVDAQLHLLQSLPQEEEFLGLPLMLAVQPLEVLLGQLSAQGLAGTDAGVLLEQLVQIPLDTQLILEGLDGHLEMLQSKQMKMRSSLCK